MSLAAAVCFLPLELFAFSEKDIISPAAGTWANVQPLVLNQTDDCDIYYSLTGSDPFVQGFSYDGPVVIDQTGNVTVRISAVHKDGLRSDFQVSYRVVPVTFRTNDADTALFIQSITQNPIRKYVSGTNFPLPGNFKYSMRNGVEPYLDAESLSLSGRNSLDRYVPCAVSDGEIKYHFVIHVTPRSVSELPVTEVPFMIDDWETLTYTGDMLIYQIDDGYWAAGTESVSLDRTVPHTVRWQSMAYEPGNPVSSLTLPPKPSLERSVSDDGSITFTLRDDSGSDYVLGYGTDSSGGYAPQVLGRSLCADTFHGDEISGELVVGVYLSGVFQGFLRSDYFLDRQSAVPPVFVPSVYGDYVRDAVSLTIRAEEGESIFYSLEDGGDFERYTGSVITLRSHDEATSYRVRAYSVDDAGNRSALAEYNVTVDQFNYYLNVNSGEPSGNGTYSRPFTSFKQAVNTINAVEYSRLHITGDIEVPSGTIVLQRNCVIIGEKSRIVMGPDSTLRIQDCSVEFESCTLEKRTGGARESSYSSEQRRNALKRFLIIKNADVRFSGCEVAGIFSDNGILLEAEDSVVRAENSGFTVQADSYACALSASGTELDLLSSRITTVSPNCINISAGGGKVSLTYSTCSVIGHLGRCLELGKSEALLVGNIFNATFDSSISGTGAVWKDSDTVFLRNEGNSVNGF